MSIYSLSPDEMVRDLINRANTPIIAFDSTNLIFGQASTVLNNPDSNTTVTARGVYAEDYAGKVALLYDRLDLGVLFRGTYRPEFAALGQSTLYRLLPELNAALGINLTQKDVLDIDLKLLAGGDQVTLELTAKPGSLAYTGFTRVLFNRKQLMLTNVVTTREYAELKHPDPVLEGYVSVGLLTWGQDFSFISPQLKVNRYGNNYKGSWVDQAAFQAALSEYFGIENFPGIDFSANSKMTLRDYATKDHPDASREFSRVVVQTLLRSNGYSGTAFFHYNP
ncbi:hypothetical protein D3C87_715640 [compost metagenome]|jgi:hypothetical protein